MGGAEAAGDARRDASAAGTRAGLVTMNSILWGNGAIHPWIVVRSSLDDVPDALWAPRKFCSRLAIMRNMYCRFVSAGRLPDFFVDLTPDEDPFYDPPGHQVREMAGGPRAERSHAHCRARAARGRRVRVPRLGKLSDRAVGDDAHRRLPRKVCGGGAP